MFKRILVAMDDTEPGRHALGKAIELAAVTGAQLRVLHVLDLADLARDAEFVNWSEQSAERMNAGQALVDAAVARAREATVDADGVLLPVETKEQKVDETVVAQAADWSADLIVLGTHGRSGLSRLLHGSVAEAVLRAASRPVLLFPPGKDE